MESKQSFRKNGMVPINGFPGYFVHPDGSVFSEHAKRILKSHVTSKRKKKPYLRISMFNSSWIQKHVLLHRILAIHFIPNPKNYPTVNHKDGNKLNNQLCNLEWASYAENIKHAVDKKLNIAKKGENHFLAKLTNDQALEIKKLCAEKRLSQTQIAKKFNVARSTVLNIHLGNAWTHLF